MIFLTKQKKQSVISLQKCECITDIKGENQDPPTTVTPPIPACIEMKNHQRELTLI